MSSPFPVVLVCVAIEKGWTQPVSQKPLSSLRLLSGPGSPKKRAFTLDCACYSSQHSTHGHVSVFISLNISFDLHYCSPYSPYFQHLCMIFRVLFLLLSSSHSSKWQYMSRNRLLSSVLEQSPNALKHASLHSYNPWKCCCVSFRHYVLNLVASLSVQKNVLCWDLLSIYKKAARMPRARPLRPGYYIIN